jgi:hypothetical protein
MKVGIIQGRLSKPDNGFQETPHRWKKEFDRLNKLNLSHIEWVVTSKSFSYNPIFTEDVSRYPISSICADNLVSELVDNELFLYHNLSPICRSALRNGINFITIPLLEDSSLENKEKLNRFCKSFSKICKEFSTLNFSLETELQIESVSKLLNIANNITLTYDTGNTTSYGISHKEYITKFISKINNVHLKDRTFSGKTVPPTTGDTDFLSIFNLLDKNNYNSLFTLQTAREESGKEEETIKKHYNTLRSIYGK